MGNSGRRLSDRLPPEVWEELRRLYVDEGLSQGEIAELQGLHTTTVHYRLDRLGVIRPRSEALKRHFQKHPRTKRPPKKYNRKSVCCLDCSHKFSRYLDIGIPPEIPMELVPTWPIQPYILSKPCPRCGGMVVPREFRRTRKRAFNREQARKMAYLYTERRWSTSQIAEHFYCVPSTVLLYLNEQGIDTHRYYRRRDNNPSYQRTVEMYELYWGYNWTTTEIAEHFGLAPSGIISRFKRAGLPMRHHGESLRLKNKRLRRQRERQDLDLRRAA